MHSVIIVDDHLIIKSALQRLLKENFEGVNIKMAVSYTELIEVLSLTQKIDLVILDIDIPGGKKHLMIDEIREIHENVPILIFSGFYDEDVYAIKYLKAGANGFISKTEPEDLILQAVKKVINGERYMSSIVQKNIVNGFIDRKGSIDPEEVLATLTPRESDVLRLLLLGKWTKEIASELHIKLSTVSVHKSRIFDKFHVDNVIDLFRKNEISRHK